MDKPSLAEKLEAIMPERVQNWFASRKVRLVIIGLLFVAAGGVLAAYVPAFGTSYATYVGGVITLVGFYFGANVSQRWVEGSHKVQIALGTPDPEKGPSPPPDKEESPDPSGQAADPG